MSTLKPILQHVLLDSAGFGLDGRGDEVREIDSLIHNLSTISQDFSVQCDPNALRHLEELCRKSNGDLDASLLQEVLTRAPIRHVPSADVSSIVAGESQFFEPRPFAALTTDENELDFPTEYLGAHITALSAFPSSSWRQEAIRLRQQHVLEFTREAVWNHIFQNFVFAPRVMFCDRYIVSEIYKFSCEGKSPSSRSGLGYFIRRLSELWRSSLNTEEDFRPRTLHVLSSTHEFDKTAKDVRELYNEVLRDMLDDLSPPFDVEFTVTNPGGALHDRFCAVGDRSGNILRNLDITNSMDTYLGEKGDGKLIKFSYQTDREQTAVIGSYWAQMTNKWREKGFRYIWKAKKP
jgi:hypothetical protein